MKTEEIALSRVSENEANPRTITEANFQKLVKSILVFPKMLQLRPIVVDETYKALGGNMRTRALCHIVSMTPEAIMDVLDTDQRLTDAEKLAIANYWSQWQEQPTATIVKASDLTEAQKKEFIIKDNAGFGDWDTDALANQLNTDLLKDWGIQDWQLQGWMSPDSLKNGEQADEDQKDAKDDEFDEQKDAVPTVCALGDVWQLGEHRLMCGDSTKAENYAVIMQGEKAQMTFSDPPYNIAFKGSMSNTTKNGVMVKNIGANQKHNDIKNDCMSKEQFEQFMLDFLQRVKDNVTGAWYISFAAGTLEELLVPLRKQGMDWKSIIIWMKNQATLSMEDYKSRYEPIAYGRFDNTFYGETAKNEDIWEYQRTLKNDLHPTMKPIPLIAHMLEMSSKEGDIILDCFGGSGSTLIACEQLGRKARLMELDPHYCDVIIARWEKLTGEKAVKIDEFKKLGE